MPAPRGNVIVLLRNYQSDYLLFQSFLAIVTYYIGIQTISAIK